MTRAPFKTRIRAGTPVVGTLITLDSPDLVEALSLAGFDWLFIDMEHGPLDIAAAQGLVRAAVGDCVALVRVPENTGLWIRRVLDIGSDGIIVPLVCSADDARRAVSAARYPPTGTRGVGIGRAHGYGLQFAEYVGQANERITVIIQIEHVDGVEHVDDILKVEGIDGVLIGPYDLSGSMNHLGDVGHPEVQAAIATVRKRCAKAGMPVGMFVLSPSDAAAEVAKGTRFIAVGTDVSYMLSTARQVLDAVRSQT